jgi:hypothetical protein
MESSHPNDLGSAKEFQRCTHDEEIDYRITRKGEPFKGHDVSLNSLSDLIVKLATTPDLHVRQSLGVSKV